MKLIALLLALIFASTAFAGAPLGVSGQNAASSFYPSVLQAPNNQVTDIGSGKGLLEHGNKNILVNPSFEHKTLGSGWTSSGTGTSSSESTIVIDGKKSYKVVMSAQTLNLSQSSSLYAAQFNGTVQGLAMVRVKSNVALTICAIQAGVVSTTLCVTTTTDNNWGLYKIPFILSATSNGISIVSASATGTAYIDDAFVGAVDLKTDGTGIDTQYSFISQTATFGAATITGTPSATSGSGIFSYNSSTGTYTVLRAGSVSVSASFAAAGAAATQPTISYNGTTVAWANSIAVSGGLSEASWEGPTVVGDTFYVTNLGGNSTSSQKIAVSAKSFSKLSTYSSTNADTDWAACNFSTLAWQGLGTVTSNLKCKRQGSDLLVAGQFTVGTPALASSQVMLPTWNGVQLAVKASTPVSIAGRATRTTGAANTVKDHSLILSGGNNFLGISYPEYSVATDPFTNQNGSNMFSAGAILSLENVRIPIEGWENSNVIVGSFKEVVTTLGVSKPVLLSAYISATSCAITSQKGSWLSLSSSSTGTCVFNIIQSLASTPICVYSPVNDGNNQSLVVETETSDSASSLTVRKRANGVLADAIAFKMVCHGEIP